jgi:hypothetical protein
MQLDIDNMRKTFFKKSLSVGHHNIKYTWAQLMVMILSCVRSMETLQEGAKEPSAQTIRDRLLLDETWLDYFHNCMWKLARFMVKLRSRYKWYISIDEQFLPFFGNRKALNKRLQKKKLGKMVHGYTAKIRGATGSFCFLTISLCSYGIRIPVAVRAMKVGEHYEPWLKPRLAKLLRLKKDAIVLADRGFGKAAWFYRMLDELDANYVVRIPLRKKENKNKAKNGYNRYMYWMKQNDTNEKVLLTVFVAKDDKDRNYYLASSIEGKRAKELLAMYLNRWDIENLFKDSDRIKLPTSSPNPNMRLFTVVVSFLLFAFWQVQPFIGCKKISLRGFVKQIIYRLHVLLGCIVSPTGILMQKPPP